MCVDKKTIENSSYENIPAGQPNVNYSDIVEKGNIDLSKRPIVKNPKNVRIAPIWMSLSLKNALSWSGNFVWCTNF